MSERPQKIELKDIVSPAIKEGETSIIFQRHGKYNRDRTADDAGSISAESAADMYTHDKAFFDQVMQQPDTFVMFTSSDTQYAGKGYRSLETAEVAKQAAIDAMVEQGMDPKERVINLNPDFKTARHDETDQDIRPIAGIREPQIFNPEDKAYLKHLQEKYGYADPDAKTGMTPEAWAAHEMDAEAEVRETTGAESEDDLIARTKKSLAILERYASIWHINNPGKRLIIWTASHYDTVSPLVKEADGRLRNNDGSLSDAYQPVDYGGGVVINIPADGQKTLERRDGRLAPIDFGGVAVKNSVTKLHQPNY